MGQKVNPCSFRLGPNLINNWYSTFYASSKEYSRMLMQDLIIRDLINSNYAKAQIGRIWIERSPSSLTVSIYTPRPGVVIGASGGDIEKLRKSLINITNISDIHINVHEIKKPDTDSKLIAQSIASQLQKRVSFKKAMKRALQLCLKQGAKGIRVNCSGRLGGAEIARTEWYREGRVPLHNLRADIEYSKAEAKTTYGIIGIKVWVYKGDKLEARKQIKN